MNAMIRTALSRRLLMPMILVLACASAPLALASSPTSAPADNAPTTDRAPAGIVDKLRGLIDSHQLAEVRTTYNGAYGASLLFHADTLGYYIALFHGKEFWRVIQTDSFDEAEKIYHAFASQTQTLAQVDIDTMRLDAGKKYAEKMVAQNQQRLQTLQRDAAYQQQQARQVATQQEQAKQQAVSLTSDLRTTSTQLDAVKQQIHALEVQQTDPTLVLPAPESKAPTAITPASPVNPPVPTAPNASP
ncbi:DUF2968 domain-containing protein [Dyella sp. 20L07]|uniref:DUF2968 domain-containing protein n=1 Tax=Dyella sp. 20L07 TaxID=3384240 RepID=UPI003D2D6780